MPVQALVFDAYGTLLDVASVEDACRSATDAASALATLWRQKQLEYSWLRTLMGRYTDFWSVTADALDYALEALGLSVNPDTRERLLESWRQVRPFPDVAPALDRLRAWRLAVLSNGTPAMLDAALRRAGLRDRFAAVLSVDLIGTYKPAPQVYRIPEEALGIPRHEVLFVSSNGWDAAGARASGVLVAWVNRRGAPPERLGAPVDLMVRDLGELADVLLARR